MTIRNLIVNDPTAQYIYFFQCLNHLRIPLLFVFDSAIDLDSIHYPTQIGTHRRCTYHVQTQQCFGKRGRDQLIWGKYHQRASFLSHSYKQQRRRRNI